MFLCSQCVGEICIWWLFSFWLTLYPCPWNILFRWSPLDPQLNPRNFIRRGRETHTDILTCSLLCHTWRLAPPQDCQSDVAPWPWTSRAVSQNTPLFPQTYPIYSIVLLITENVLICDCTGNSLTPWCCSNFISLFLPWLSRSWSGICSPLRPTPSSSGVWPFVSARALSVHFLLFILSLLLHRVLFLLLDTCLSPPRFSRTSLKLGFLAQ